MDIIKLPIENATEPEEEARQPGVYDKGGRDGKLIESITTIAPTTTAHESVLSQPPKGITHKQKLLWLQQRRTEGLWVQCDSCDHWRYLPQVLDSHELPAKWYCWMNPDKSLATCSTPEVPICLYDEDDLIHAEYAAGSIVLARMPGFPWWPAMVCDCPDTEQYYWLDGFSDIPTHYNVVFFDAFDVSRAWMAPQQLMPYKGNTKILKKSIRIKKFKNRLEVATVQANDAEKLSLSARLEKYSFLARFTGRILSPKKIKKQEVARYRNMLMRKLKIVDFSDESGSSDEEVIEVEKTESNKRKVQKKTNKTDIQNKPKPQSHEVDSSHVIENITENLNNTRDLNSLAVQIDSHSGINKSIVSDDLNNNKEQEISIVSDSYVSQSLQSQDTTNAMPIYEEDSQLSDNFEF